MEISYTGFSKKLCMKCEKCVNITQKQLVEGLEAAARRLFCVWIEETGKILHKSPGPPPLLMQDWIGEEGKNHSDIK